jgi:hypothetical protein
MNPDKQKQMLDTAFPNGAMLFQLNPGEIKSPTFTLGYEGSFNIVFAGKPNGKVVFKMDGFQKTIESLQKAAASDPSVNQIIGPLMAAQGFSKQKGKALVWAVEITAQGAILVNGIDVSKMAGP